LTKALNSSILAVDGLAIKAILLLGAGEVKGFAINFVWFRRPDFTAIAGKSAIPKSDSTICSKVSKLVASIP
jgi:hypothetical protein